MPCKCIIVQLKAKELCFVVGGQMRTALVWHAQESKTADQRCIAIGSDIACASSLTFAYEL